MLNDVFKILAATPQKLKLEIAGLSPRELKQRPRPEKWSIQMILAHLSDLEEFYRKNRVQAILQNDVPTLIPFEQEQRAAELHYDRTDPHRTLTQFVRRRRANLQLFSRVKPQEWKRAGVHPEAGEIRLEEIVTEWAFHDLGHIRQIIEVKRYALFPRIGNMKKFYNFG